VVEVKEGCVVSEVENNHPLLSVIPCSLAAACQNLRVQPSGSQKLNELLKVRLTAEDVVIGQNCRESLRGVLDVLGIRSADDEVAVFTTSGRPYLSGCVSRSIDAAGSWTRETVSAQTKAILVVHEFGYPYEDVSRFRTFGLPIIEDAAFSFNSRFLDGDLVGTRGDYAVFSFSKFFNIQIGGASVRLNRTVPALPLESDGHAVKYVKGVILSQYSEIDEYTRARMELFQYYVERFKDIGAVPYFENEVGVVPSVFLFRAPTDWNLVKLKEYLWTRGIQCTVFYGDHAFYLPLHQAMEEATVDYLYWMVRSFFDENK
jgi:dTDP-4-amino-4,6-dideoxygalactose transaminase